MSFGFGFEVTIEPRTEIRRTPANCGLMPGIGEARRLAVGDDLLFVDSSSASRRCNVEIPLKVGFSWSASVQFRVRHDECQILTLKLCESTLQLILPATLPVSAV
jgi:hypothetical protein